MEWIFKAHVVGKWESKNILHPDFMYKFYVFL